MAKSEFRCVFFARDYESTVAFYRDGLELPVVETWDRGRDDRGTLFRAASRHEHPWASSVAIPAAQDCERTAYNRFRSR